MASSVFGEKGLLKTIAEILKLIRWFHELLVVLPFAALYFTVSYYSAKTGTPCNLSIQNFIALCAGVQLLVSAGCILNDIMDRHIDRVNKPSTHTIGRTISLSAAKKLFIVNTLLIVAISIYISTTIFVEWAYIALVVYLLSVVYDVYLKRSPLFGNILIAILASFIPIVLYFYGRRCINALPGNKIDILLWLYIAFPFFVIVARELSLDISDIEGDKKENCRTLPILIGIKKSKIVVASILLFVSAVLLFLSFLWSYLALSLILVALMLLFYLLLLKKAVTRIEYIRAGRFLWFIMIIGLIGFTVSTVL